MLEPCSWNTEITFQYKVTPKADQNAYYTMYHELYEIFKQGHNQKSIQHMNVQHRHTLK